jgi:hypothetical protein
LSALGLGCSLIPGALALPATHALVLGTSALYGRRLLHLLLF